MKHTLFLLLLLAFSFVPATRAQHLLPHTAFAKGTVADPAEDQYDINYIRLDLALSNQSIALAGNVVTKATVQSVPMSQYVFELHSGYLVDSVKVNGQVCAVTNIGAVRSAAMGSPLQPGSSFVAQVWYRTAIPALPNVTGITCTPFAFSGSRVVSTVSEPYESLEWWPCKQSLQDKIDSADIWLTVPDSLKGIGNGLLKNVVTMPGSTRRYEWSTHFPMDYYLLFIGVANYRSYDYYVHFSGSTDSVLVQNFLPADTVSTYRYTQSHLKPYLDTPGMVLDYFSTLFGRYPFWREKYGQLSTASGRGMEHQTISAVGADEFDEGYVACHELAHQWWGDHVTCGTWKDIWLNEGMATYCDYLWNEHFHGAQDGLNYMKFIHSGYYGATLVLDGSVYISNGDTSEARVFNPYISYSKGASAAHMLRYLAPADSLFFKALRLYQQQFAFKTAVTADFKSIMENVYGRSLDTFFNEWVYGEGYVQYRLGWNSPAGKVYLKLNQSGSKPSSVPYFHFPVEVQLHSSTGDTIVTINMQHAADSIAVNWPNHQVISCIVDPHEWVPHKAIYHMDQTLAAPSQSVQEPSVVPNPTSTAWNISGIAEGAWRLTDVTGKLLMRGSVTSGLIIPAVYLPPAVYILEIITPDGQRKSQQLIRR